MGTKVWTLMLINFISWAGFVRAGQIATRKISSHGRIIFVKNGNRLKKLGIFATISTGRFLASPVLCPTR
jgi:hypothetical protein